VIDAGLVRGAGLRTVTGGIERSAEGKPGFGVAWVGGGRAARKGDGLSGCAMLQRSLGALRRVLIGRRFGGARG
jgi:hypothetical protein